MLRVLLILFAALALSSGVAPAAGSGAGCGVPDPNDIDCDGYRIDQPPYDNCPDIANPGQANTDAGYTESSPPARDGSTAPMAAGDGAGDACDLDDDADAVDDRVDTDGDGVRESRLDNCPLVRNPGQTPDAP